MPDKDISRYIQSDAKKIRSLEGGVKRPSPPKLIEGVLWGLAILSVVAMLAVMPWVGDGKPIPGTVWLGYSLLGILIFGGLAVLLHVVFSPVGEEYGRRMDNRFQEGR